MGIAGGGGAGSTPVHVYSLLFLSEKFVLNFNPCTNFQILQHLSPGSFGLIPTLCVDETKHQDVILSLLRCDSAVLIMCLSVCMFVFYHTVMSSVWTGCFLMEISHSIQHPFYCIITCMILILFILSTASHSHFFSCIDFDIIRQNFYIS